MNKAICKIPDTLFVDGEYKNADDSSFDLEAYWKIKDSKFLKSYRTPS